MESILKNNSEIKFNQTNNTMQDSMLLLNLPVNYTGNKSKSNFSEFSVSSHGFAKAKVNGYNVEASVCEDGELTGVCSCHAPMCIHINTLGLHLLEWADANRHREKHMKKNSDLISQLLRKSK
ncbi:hypothetical protein PPL_01468 [Heterostelium album PN500]|uniref:SWIM-type domain-containing protein n=1 Tax=Heterostelium pallidum (strain ATCC 26659 / Pp 5 / PN500) TaxID=670386 RepID=D3AZC8_HETP5|nr:hypothetical protein PPL_01468 [Heterostelium album PN500]EFA85511.1 hypothetical protein PPL_01468 [Heterostelium album PN500]|eukprot:XP_020437619.1 hypothetical protein PPL_01468 [Heterostelium album PN500]